MRLVPVLTSGALLAAVALAVPTAASGAVPRLGQQVTDSGSFSVLTYNVAGLPEVISGGNPAVNTRPIGERVNDYDIVAVQEDFNYHAALYATDRHPHRTPTSGGVPFGDGLNAMSNYAYSDFIRVRWNSCNGTDCLTPKGFSLARIRLAEGVVVDVYNAHTNAGTTDADLAARRSNITQLSDHIAANSAGNAVLVLGDLNVRYTRAGDNIRELTAANGLTDAWVQQERGGVPPAAGSPAILCDPANVTNACEVVDKILYRGNRLIDLVLTGYQNEHHRFLDQAGQPLSDHYPHAAWLRWTLHPELRMSDTWGGPHGTAFTDVARVGLGARVSAVSLRAGARLDQVGLSVGGGPSVTHGGGGGTPASLTMAVGEYVNQVTLTQGQRNGRTRIFSVRFVTNQGRILAGGSPTSAAVTYTAPAGWQLAGFHGRAGAEVDKLGLIWTPAPG